MGQDKGRGGELYHNEDRIDQREDQGGKEQTDEEGAGWLDVSQHGVAVPNRRGVN